MPEDFGLISMVTAITAIAERFKDFGLSTATIQQKHISQEQVSKLFWINVATGLAITIFVSAMSYFVAAFFREERLIYVTIAIAISFLWSGATVQHQAILQRQMKYAAIGGIQIGSSVASLGIATLLALKGYGYWALVWREVLRNVFTAIGTWMCCPWAPDAPRRHVNIDYLMKFGRDITGFNVIVFLTANVDQILIGKLYGAAHLGLYRQAYQLIFWPVMQLVVPVTRVAAPTLSFLQDNADRYRRSYQKMLTTVNFFMMPLILFAVTYSSEIVLVVLGENWIGAAPIFRVLAIAAFIAPASDTTGLLLVTCGKTRRYLSLGVVTGVVLLLSFGIGVNWGALGVAYGYLVAAYTLLVLRLLYSFDGTPVTLGAFCRAIEKPLVASAAMMVVLVVIWNRFVNVHHTLGLLTMSMPVAVITYVGAWLVIPGGRAALTEILYDLSASLHLDRRYSGVMSSRSKKARAS